jgi:hypothetical protein
VKGFGSALLAALIEASEHLAVGNEVDSHFLARLTRYGRH